MKKLKKWPRTGHGALIRRLRCAAWQFSRFAGLVVCPAPALADLFRDANGRSPSVTPQPETTVRVAEPLLRLGEQPFSIEMAGLALALALPISILSFLAYDRWTALTGGR